MLCLGTWSLVLWRCFLITRHASTNEHHQARANSTNQLLANEVHSRSQTFVRARSAQKPAEQVCMWNFECLP